MSPLENRKQVLELAKRVREAAKLQEPLAKAIVDLVQLQIELVKESLVDAVGDDMLRTQGAARHLIKLHRELTTTPPNITRGEPE